MDTEGTAYTDYIRKDFDGKYYDEYVEEAVKVSCIYIKALLMLYESQIDDIARRNFLQVVRNADLGAPLEVVTEAKVEKYLGDWLEEIQKKPGKVEKYIGDWLEEIRKKSGVDI